MKRIIICIGIITILSINLSAGGKKELPLLLDGTALKSALDNQNITIVDFGRSAEAYEEGHIESAVYLPRESVWTEVDGISGMFPGVEQAVAAIRKAGISRDKPVVIYDGTGNLWASRLFWTLEYLGHEDVHLLDGGIQGWTARGYTLSTEAVSPIPSEFKAEVNEKLIIGKDDLFNGLESNQNIIVDTRSPGEYSGDDVRSARGGHIPGSINVDWVNNVHSEERYFLSDSELAELYDFHGVDKDASIVTLCQTGVRGAHTYFVLRNLGYEDVALYDGSWAEWGNASNLPVKEGAN